MSALTSVSPKFVGSLDAARIIGLSKSTIEKMRMVGNGPRFAKLGSRVVYAIEDLEAWVKERAVGSVSEADVLLGRTGGLRRGRPPGRVSGGPQS